MGWTDKVNEGERKRERKGGIQGRDRTRQFEYKWTGGRDKMHLKKQSFIKKLHKKDGRD